ncbi:MAG: AEC family transporter [Alkalilacustris sp.]
MTALLTVAQIVAPVAALASVGFAWVRSGRDWPVAFVTRLAMGLAVPCLVFTALMGAEMAPEVLARTALAAAAGYGGLLALFGALAWALRLDPRAHVAPLAFGNTGNLGLPLVYFAFGEAGLAVGVAVFATGLVAQFSLGLWLMAGGGGTRALREPGVWAAVLGGVFLWQGWQTPGWITETLGLMGQMAIPLMLLTLGAAVARLGNTGRWGLGLASGLAILRLGLCAGVALAVGWMLLPDPLARAVLVLQLTMPVPVTAYLMAERVGADGAAVAGLVLASTLLAILSIPLALMLLI